MASSLQCVRSDLLEPLINEIGLILSKRKNETMSKRNNETMSKRNNETMNHGE